MPAACPSCGKPVAERASRCPFCGVRTRDPGAPGTAPVAATTGVAGSGDATRAVDLAKLARIAQDLESLQSRRRKKRDRLKIAAVAAVALTFVGAAVLMLPWFRSLGALGLVGDLKGGGAAHMAAERIATDSANTGVGDTSPASESSGPDAGDATRALAERAGGAAAPAADLPAAASATPPSEPRSEGDDPRASGTATLAKLDDLARIKRTGGGPRSSAAAAPSSAARSPSALDSPFDWELWRFRAAGFAVGMLAAALVSQATRARAASAASGVESHPKRMLRALPLAALSVVALGALAYELEPELAKLRGREVSFPEASAPSRPSPKRAPSAVGATAPSATAPSPSAAPSAAALAPSGAPSASAGATQHAQTSGRADTTKNSDAKPPSAARPTNFAGLVSVLRERQASESGAARPFRRLRSALSARRQRDVGAQTHAPALAADQTATSGSAPAAAPMLPKGGATGAASPPHVDSSDPTSRRQAGLMGLLVGLALGSAIALIARVVRRAPTTAATAVALASLCGADVAHAAGAPSAALAAKFVSCYQAEGGVAGDEDHASLDSIASEVGAMVPAIPDSVMCPGASDEASCASAIESTSCETIAAGLAQALGVSLVDPAPEPWAQAYGSAVSDKLLACLVAETGTAPAAADADLVSGYGRDLARLAGSLTTANRCRVDPSALPACLDGIRAVTCAATLDAVGPTLAPVDAGATSSAESYEDAEAAAEADAPALSDAELDRQIDVVAANTKSPVPFLADVCRDLLACAADSAYDDDAP